MKVSERKTDRKANVHLFLHEHIPPLEEYGEFVNPKDKAVECFVPVEEGQQIRIGGKFSGTTSIIGYDVCVDGICRKSHTYIRKTVSAQRCKKLDADKLLFKTSNGSIVKTEIRVAKIPAGIVLEEDGAMGLGAIEVRIYVLRRFGDEHALQGIDPYYAVRDEGHAQYAIDDYDGSYQSVGYKTIAPEFTMTFQKNVTALDQKNALRNKKMMDAKRSGNEPWAVFRFHFRSKRSILDNGLEMTFDTSAKKKEKKYRELDIEELPMLPVEEKPKKDVVFSRDTPTSSTAPSMTAKSSTDECSTFTPETASFRISSDPSTQITPARKPFSKKETRQIPECSSTPDAELSETKEEEDEGLRTRIFSSHKSKLSISPGLFPGEDSTFPNTLVADMALPVKPNITSDVNGATNGEMAAKATKEVSGSLGTSDRQRASGEKETEIDTAALKQAKYQMDEDASCKPSIDDTMSRDDAGLDNGIQASISATLNTFTPPAQKSADITNGTGAKTLASNATGPTNGTILKSASVPVSLMPYSAVDGGSITPAKRLVTLDAPSTPDTKRTKLSLASTLNSRASSSALSAKDRFLFDQVAEARKRKQEMQAKRKATAEMQSDVDKKLSPYQQKLQDELDRLNRETEEDARQHEEDEERLKDSIAWLQELQGGEMEYWIDNPSGNGGQSVVQCDRFG